MELHFSKRSVWLLRINQKNARRAALRGGTGLVVIVLKNLLKRNTGAFRAITEALQNIYFTKNKPKTNNKGR